jgi:hypothetical protein
MAVTQIWLALIARDLESMENILSKDNSQANTRQPSGELLLDTALIYGYLPESKLLHKYGGLTEKSPLGSGVFLGDVELLNWIYDVLDKDVNNSSVVNAVFASKRTTDAEKFLTFKFLLDKGSNPNLYRFNALVASPLATKYLVENGFMDLTAKSPSNRTLQDEIELRKIPHPFTLYTKPDKSNELFVAITNGDLSLLSDTTTTTNINVPLTNFVGTPYHYALSIGAIDAAKLLVSLGANTQYTTPSGENAIGSALRANSLECVNLAREGLPESAINVLYTNKRNMQVSVLQQAISRCVSTEVFKSLLQPLNGKPGANPNVLCGGVPPVGWISYIVVAPDFPFTNHVDMFVALVNAGAKPDIYNNAMRTTPRQHYLSTLRNPNLKGRFTQEMIDIVSTYKI